METAAVQRVDDRVDWRPMTEEEFEAWCDEDVRAEFVDGEVIVHSPVSTRHSKVVLLLSGLLQLFVEHHELGQILGPEIQVRLRPGLRRVPDLLFVAADRASLIGKNRVDGAPDLSIEIVSPDSVARDWRDKYLEYQATGVREYWVIDPDHERAEFYALSDEGEYQLLPVEEGIVRSSAVPGFWLRIDWLWKETLPGVLGLARELEIF